MHRSVFSYNITPASLTSGSGNGRQASSLCFFHTTDNQIASCYYNGLLRLFNIYSCTHIHTRTRSSLSQISHEPFSCQKHWPSCRRINRTLLQVLSKRRAKAVTQKQSILLQSKPVFTQHGWESRGFWSIEHFIK